MSTETLASAPESITGAKVTLLIELGSAKSLLRLLRDEYLINNPQAQKLISEFLGKDFQP